jgi:Fe-Mn family superoxide dismutase
MRSLSRRQFIATTGSAAACLLAPVGSGRLCADEKHTGFTLPKLPYSFDALEPSIDARTMEIHHDKHHAAYVKNLNEALAGHDKLLEMPIQKLIKNLNEVPEAIRQKVRNNGGGHANHSFFWEVLSHDGEGKPAGRLAEAIDSTFGDFAKFQAAFKKAGLDRFGSGWAWLVVDDGKLKIVSTANQDSPLTDGHHPVLGLDVWEHAYYLKYQNRRADYVDAWWKVVNWHKAGEHFNHATKGA